MKLHNVYKVTLSGVLFALAPLLMLATNIRYGFLPVFCPVLCFFTDSLHMKQIFKKKIGPSLLFLAAGTTDTKFLVSTGVATVNSTNKYQKYKSVDLGDQLAAAVTVDCVQLIPKYHSKVKLRSWQSTNISV